MRSYVYILYQLAWLFTGLPPEVLGALLLLVFTNPVAFAVVFFILKYIAGTVASGIVAWYLKALFEYYVWPEIPPEHRRALLKIRDAILPGAADQDRDGG